MKNNDEMLINWTSEFVCSSKQYRDKTKWNNKMLASVVRGVSLLEVVSITLQVATAVWQQEFINIKKTVDGQNDFNMRWCTAKEIQKII